MLKFRCGSCGKKIAVDDASDGKRVRCPKCGGVNFAHQELAAEPVTAEAPAWPGPELEAQSLLQTPPDEPAPHSVASGGVRAYPTPMAAPPPPPAVYAPPPPAGYAPAPMPPRGPVVMPYHAPAYAAPSGGANGLGVASLVIGLVALLAAWIPFCGLMTIPVAAIGLILGIVGFCVSTSNKRTGVGFPVAGSAVCLVAIVGSLVITFGLMAGAARQAQKQALQQQQQQQQQMTTPAPPPFPGFTTLPPPPPPGSPFSRAQDVVTPAEYSRVHQGMSYSQVTGIVGAPGKELSRIDMEAVGRFVPRTTTVVYVWENPRGSNMTVTFQNDKLVTKAQFGLR